MMLFLTRSSSSSSSFFKSYATRVGTASCDEMKAYDLLYSFGAATTQTSVTSG